MSDAAASRRPAAAADQALTGALRAGTYWGFLGRLAAVAAVVVSNAVAARMLTPSELGLYFLAIAFVTLGAAIAVFGLDRLVVRWVAEAGVQQHQAEARLAARRLVGLGAGIALGMSGSS